MNSNTLKKYNKALNELKIPLNKMLPLLFEIDCKVIPLPLGGDKIKMLIFDKGNKIKKEPIYKHDEFKVKQIEFFNYFYNKYFDKYKNK